jgi:hypothetical protein
VNWLPETVGAATVAAMQPLLRQSRHIMTSGPRLRLDVDGRTSGDAVASNATTCHRVRIDAWPAPGELTLGRVQLLGTGGRVLAEVSNFPGGMIDIEVAGDDRGGWLVARVFGAADDPLMPRQQAIRHCALTNPVYLDAPQTPRFTAITSAVRLEIPTGSPWRGGEMIVRSAAGDELERGHLREASVTCQAPATATVVVRQGAQERLLPLALAAAAPRAHIDYLAFGGFLKEWPDCTSGEVPVEAFHFDAVRQDLAQITIDLASPAAR